MQKNPQGQVSTTLPSGVTKCEFPDGSKLTRQPDGSQVTICADGTKIEEPVGGDYRKKATKPNGAIITTYRNGKKVGIFEDGCIVEEYQRIKTTRKPNGTVIVDYLEKMSSKSDEDPSKIVVKECTFSDKTVIYTYVVFKTHVYVSQENPSNTNTGTRTDAPFKSIPMDTRRRYFRTERNDSRIRTVRSLRPIRTEEKCRSHRHRKLPSRNILTDDVSSDIMTEPT